MIDRYVDEYLKGIFNSALGVEAEVTLLRERYPHLDRARLAERIVADAVTRSGQLGAVLGIPTLVPVLGTAFLFGTITADASLLLREQLSMLIKLSFLYDPERPRADRELDAADLFARHAATDELPTSATPATVGHFARIVFKHLARRLLDHVWRRSLSAWFAIPLSLIISAKVNRDSTGELGEFAAMELDQRGRA